MALKRHVTETDFSVPLPIVIHLEKNFQLFFLHLSNVDHYVLTFHGLVFHENLNYSDQHPL